jgi:hypothetical protein
MPDAPERRTVESRRTIWPVRRPVEIRVEKAAEEDIFVAHSGMDRMAGYGLKLPSSFRDTHLGRIGRGS